MQTCEIKHRGLPHCFLQLELQHYSSSTNSFDPKSKSSHKIPWLLFKVFKKEYFLPFKIFLPLPLSFLRWPLASLQSCWGQLQSKQAQQGSRTTPLAYKNLGIQYLIPLKNNTAKISSDLIAIGAKMFKNQFS